MSTISDKYFTDWISLEEAKEIMIYRARRRHRAEIKDIIETFPNGFTNPVTRIIY